MTPPEGQQNANESEMSIIVTIPTAGRTASDDKDYSKVVNSQIFDDVVDSRRSRSDNPDDLFSRWTRSPAVSTVSLAGWNLAHSRVTLVSRRSSSSSGETGSGNDDVTPSPTSSDFRCLRTPEVGSASDDEDDSGAGNVEEAGGNATLSRSERKLKRKRKWKRYRTPGTSNPISRQQPYRRLDDDGDDEYCGDCQSP